MNEHMDVTLMIADDESFILRGLKEIVSDSDWNCRERHGCLCTPSLFQP